MNAVILIKHFLTTITVQLNTNYLLKNDIKLNKSYLTIFIVECSQYSLNLWNIKQFISV